ncbi:DUF5667 domain-containing protein [Actinokineospora auranticolor]|uniref:DUF5667 domain-containing protein n=1 Tax=Actinokineospora auranticolor TaxID=155976 RepID=A0A2S6GW30_9PSEU|nr:DUF5667 domain-containing protein [Actinokineospora auranticolor]PPK69407.1 hypothetical protein CLV40_10313 [Actinokineospora auranticolor]
MVDSGSGSSGPHGERAERPRAGRSHPGLLDEAGDMDALDDLGPDFTEDDRAILELLAGLGSCTAPDDGSRDRMRAKVLAGLAAEPALDTAAAETAPGLESPLTRPAPAPRPRPARAQADSQPTAQPTRPPRNAGRAPRGRRGGSAESTRPGAARAGSGVRSRFAVAATAALALVFALAGTSLLLARDALPGDALYGIKRTGEAASLGLTFGAEDKAFKHLEFAAARVSEIETLALRSTDPRSAPSEGYLAALGDFDSDATAGARALTGIATAGDGAQLEPLRAWADQQGARLAALRPRLPGAADNRLTASLALLDRIEDRAGKLITRLPCYQVVSGDLDEIGAMPATATCDVRPDAPRIAPPTTGSDAGGRPAPGQPTTTAPTEAPPTTGTPPPDVRSTRPATPPVTSTSPPPLIQLPPILGGPTTTAPGTGTKAPGLTVPLPLPLPTISVPPLVPGLVGSIEIG